MPTLFYDCEIMGDPTVLGWDAYKELGISVIGCWDSISQDFSYILADPIFPPTKGKKELKDFQALVNQCDQIIGFNSKNFDDPLCWAHQVDIKTTFDLLEEVRIAAYGSPDWEDQPKGFSYKLDALAKFNLDYSKSGHGALAPKLWSEGKYQEVIDYCINDVRILKDLYELFLAGKLKDPNTGAPLIYRKVGG